MTEKWPDVTAAEIKGLAKRVGADCVGIAPMSRWEGAPIQNDPRYIFPRARSMVVLGFRIPRGLLRGIEEGTRFIDYPGMGYASINQVHGPMVLWKLNAYLEERGYEVFPLQNANGGDAVNPVTGKFREGLSRHVADGRPAPDVLVHFRIAAYLASMLFFSLYHVWTYALQDPVYWIYLLEYIPVAGLLCRCYERTNSIWCSIFFHMMVNGVAVNTLSALQELL